MTLTRERPVRDETVPELPLLDLAESEIPDLDLTEFEIPESWRVDQPPPPPLPQRMAAYLSAPISPVRAAGLAIAWVVLFSVGLAVEPPPADPEAVGGFLSDFLFPLTLLGAMGAMFLGLAQRRRWGVVGAVVASGALVVASALCPASGHHTYGTWWLVQMGAAGTALGLSWRTLRAG